MDARGRLLEELTAHVGDDRVLAALAEVPRDRFVTADRLGDAWANVALPIGSGQTISQPYVVARMCSLLALQGDERVLDVGTGSGYHAAVLARLCAHVWTVERHADLAASAAARLRALGIGNVTCAVGDGTAGMPDAAPFDAINVAAATGGEVPPALLEQLAPGGRLVAPVGADEQRLTRIGADGRSETFDRVRFVPLIAEPARPPD